MEITDIIELVEHYAEQKKCIYILAYSEGYCEPRQFEEHVCFIKSTKHDEINENIVKFLNTISKHKEFEFGEYFQILEANFTLDGYNNVIMKNCVPESRVDFSKLENDLKDALVKDGWKQV